MRLLMPSVAMRKRLITYLTDFFEDSNVASYNRAVGSLAVFYEVRLPKTQWVNSSDTPNHGECDSTGTIVLVHPDSWRKRKTYNTLAKWIDTFLHEMAHYLLIVDAETKADQFARKIIRGTGGSNGS